MERRKSRCGDIMAHGEHYVLRHGEAVTRTGWTHQEADATDLAARLDQVARENAWPLSLPPGIKLECHPLVPHVLQQLFIPSYAEFSASLATGEDVLKPQIPVVVTPGWGRGQWRITADDGLIAEGTVRDG